jgi:hypothetical protein
MASGRDTRPCAFGTRLFWVHYHAKWVVAHPSPSHRSSGDPLFRENPRKISVREKVRESVSLSLKVQQCNCRWHCESKCNKNNPLIPSHTLSPFYPFPIPPDVIPPSPNPPSRLLVSWLLLREPIKHKAYSRVPQRQAIRQSRVGKSCANIYFVLRRTL